jgi:hypothetical protein
VHLVGFTIEIYYDARFYKRQISILVLFMFCFPVSFTFNVFTFKRKMMDDMHKIYHTWWRRCEGPAVAPSLVPP